MLKFDYQHKGVEMKQNKDAEMAYLMAMKLLGSVSKDKAIQVWDECHENTQLQKLVSVYTYSTPSYAPKALDKVQTKLMEVFG